MSEQPNTISAETPTWRDRARRVLTDSGRVIADILTPGAGAEEINAELIKVSRNRLCVRVSVGTSTGFLKQFDGSATACDQAYTRERDMLTAMKRTGLVPRLRAFSDRYRWLLTEDIRDGDDPAARLSPEQFGRQAGTWIARFEAVAPYQKASGNWLGYVTRLGLGPQLDRIEQAAETLAGIPLCGLVMARNDAALHNYLMKPDRTLLGCDFERTSLKPRGWEYMTTWQALLQRLGDDSTRAVQAFSDGFDKEHRGGLMIDELNAVARILFCARFLQMQDKKQRAA